MMITDKYINDLFEGTNFGEATNNCVKKKREQLAKTLRNQVDGYWSGHTAYNIAVDGGFLKDAKRGGVKELTVLGVVFLEDCVSLARGEKELDIVNKKGDK